MTTEMGLPINQADTNVEVRVANDSSATRRFDWADSLPKDGRPAYVSQQLPVSKRPVMLARDAEGAGDDQSGLLDIASFLRNTAPAKDIKRGSWHSVKQVPSAQGKLVKRVFKVGSRKSLRTPFAESSKDDHVRKADNINYTERISKSGHKYIHITPLGASSLGSEACEVEANQERPFSSRPTANPQLRPATAVPRVDPLKSRSPSVAAPPKTAPAAIRTSDGSDIHNYVSDLQDEMQRRWQSPLRVRKPPKSGSPRPSPTKGLTAHRYSTQDHDVSAILRATGSPSKRAFLVTTHDGLTTTEDAHGPHTPSQGLRSHPAKPPSPPPRKPLPEVPGGYQPNASNNPSKIEDDRDTMQSSTTDQSEADIHPLFRSTPERLTPRGNAFQSASGTPTSTTRNSLLTSRHDASSEIDAHQASPPPSPILDGQWKQDSQPSGTLLASAIYVKGQSTNSESSTDPPNIQIDDHQPSTPTPMPQNREDRIRVRKLRHLQTAKQGKDTRSKPLPSPDPSPTTSGQSDSRPSTAISSVPTLASDTTATRPLSLVNSVTDHSPSGFQINPMPMQKDRSSERPAPLSFSSQLSNRLSSLPEPSPPFPYDDPLYTYTTNTDPVIMQELCELLPAIRLPPINASQKHLSNDSNGTELATDHFPLPHQRLSFASMRSQQCAAHAQKSNQSSQDNQGIPQSATSSTFAGPEGSIHTASGDSLDTRLGYLERKNKLLEAALIAVLRTNGRMNGCVTCAEKRLSTLSTSSRTQRYSLFPTDSTKPKDVTHDRDTVARSASVATLNSQYSHKSERSRATVDTQPSQGSRSSGSTQSKSGIGALELYKATRLDISSISPDM